MLCNQQSLEGKRQKESLIPRVLENYPLCSEVWMWSPELRDTYLLYNWRLLTPKCQHPFWWSLELIAPCFSCDHWRCKWRYLVLCLRESSNWQLSLGSRLTEQSPSACMIFNIRRLLTDAQHNRHFVIRYETILYSWAKEENNTSFRPRVTFILKFQRICWLSVFHGQFNSPTLRISRPT